MNVSLTLQRIEHRLAKLETAVSIANNTPMTVEDVMLMTGLSRSTVYSKTSSHGGLPPELPHFKKGKRLYFRHSDITAWMTQHSVKGREEIDRAAGALTPTAKRSKR